MGDRASTGDHKPEIKEHEMKGKTERIILKSDQPNGVEISIGTFTVKAKQGKPVEVPINEVQGFLSTGRFDLVKGTAADKSDLPKDLPGRKIFKAAGLDFEQVKKLSITLVGEMVGIGPKILADFTSYADWITPDEPDAENLGTETEGGE